MLAALLLLGWTFTAQSAEGQFRCFPSCSSTDARFLVVASGTGLVTLSDELIDIEFAVPAGTSSFQIGFFDGDSGGAHWDLGGTTPYSYTLYADPLGTGSQTTPVFSASSLTMPDNAWIDFTIDTTIDALSPSGNYFYHLHIALLNNTVTSYNSFKLRTTGVATVRLEDQPFSYMATINSFADLLTVYPSYPTLTPTTYDGTFRFFFHVLDPGTDLSIWDGDFDHGRFDGTDLDTDDPDTPNAPFLPSWATVDAVSEGVATGLPATTTGNPPDDTSTTAFLRPPSLRYDLIFPDSQSFANDNPSGNQEWEQFRISTDPFDPSLMDYSTASIPSGTYELRASGVDLANLNALRLPNRALCVSDAFEPCTPLFPFLVGDTVFRDLDADGVQSGAGETGIAGVAVELVGTTGYVIATTTTDADGEYSFNVPAGTYTVQIADSNFDPGGLLDGAIATTPVLLTETVVDDNVLTYDFGYRGTGSIGDRLWFDFDGDGDQDTGEDGINGVTVELLDGDGNVLATTTTSGDGDYLFDHLFPGSYSVRVVASTLPAGLEPTDDFDGTGTPHLAAVTLGAGEDQMDVDFGYRGTASVGDRLWNDVNGNGIQDGEAGLNGVTVELLDGDGNVVATTTTGGDGNYSFLHLTPGAYSVRVVSSTLPAGIVPTYDLDGTGTPHIATFALGVGENREDVDFGYRIPPCAPGYFKDHFSAASFSNNDGSLSWSGPWIESDVAGSGVSSGNVTVGSPYGGYLFLRDSPDTGTQPSAAREANLSGFASATLSFSFHVRTAVDPDDAVAVEVSNDGGASYTVLETLSGFSGTHTGSRSYDISAFISANTRIRFRVSNNYGAGDEIFKLDWVKIDAGCVPPQTASIGDRLWYDTDGDGIQDAGEPGLGGTKVELLDSGGTVIATTTANSNGVYAFANLAAGSYTVRVVPSTLPAGGLAPTYDLDGTGTPHTAAVTLSAGQTRTDADFGYRGTRSLGDRIWQDLDGDGAQDAGESGINGVTVRLFLGSTEVASTVTAGDGNYSFSNLPETTFTVRIDTATLPAGVTQTYDLDGLATPHQATVNLTSSRTDVDFGYRTPPVSCTAGYFKDHFSTTSFSNNDGSLSWSGAWIESDVAGAGVSSGNVTVGKPYSGYLFLRDYPDTGTQPSAAREANLSGFASATLSFSFHVRTAVDPDDAVTVEVSNNGGASYTVLETLSGFSGTYTGSRSYDISAFIAGNTRIRFRVSNNYGASDELFKLDWVKIDASCAPAPPGEAPGTGTIGYWKNHPEDWPVEQITVGGRTYTKSQAIAWMGTASRGDKTIDLFKQLVAAKLNVLVGNEAGCISSTVAGADAWLSIFPPGSKVKSSSSAWSTGGPLHTKLDDYNNGELCAPHRG